MRVNQERIQKRLEAIAEKGKDPEGGWSRLAFTDSDREARDLTIEMMLEAGMEVRVDPAGNIIGFFSGTEPNAPMVAMGSHLDTVKNGGMFDGIAGVVTGIEVVQTIKEKNLPIKNPLGVIVFADEEGARFNYGFLGSKALTGQLSDFDFAKYIDSEGNNLYEALEKFSLNPQEISKAQLKPEQFKAFFELHVEQGSVLEDKNKKIGIVSGIKGPCWMKGCIRGKANHAGSTPMKMRQDALSATGELICLVESIAKKASDSLVATIGTLNVKPGSINTIPELTEFTLDVRDVDLKQRQFVVEEIKNVLERIQEERKVITELEIIREGDPVVIKSHIIEMLKDICEEKKIPYEIMASGSGHDAMIMTNLTDVGMIFIPSRGGLSHCPGEWSDWEDLAMGAEVLLDAVLRMAN